MEEINGIRLFMTDTRLRDHVQDMNSKSVTSNEVFLVKETSDWIHERMESWRLSLTRKLLWTKNDKWWETRSSWWRSLTMMMEPILIISSSLNFMDPHDAFFFFPSLLSWLMSLFCRLWVSWASVIQSSSRVPIQAFDLKSCWKFSLEWMYFSRNILQTRSKIAIKHLKKNSTENLVQRDDRTILIFEQWSTPIAMATTNCISCILFEWHRSALLLWSPNYHWQVWASQKKFMRRLGAGPGMGYLKVYQVEKSSSAGHYEVYRAILWDGKGENQRHYLVACNTFWARITSMCNFILCFFPPLISCSSWLIILV